MCNSAKVYFMSLKIESHVTITSNEDNILTTLYYIFIYSILVTVYYIYVPYVCCNEVTKIGSNNKTNERETVRG